MTTDSNNTDRVQSVIENIRKGLNELGSFDERILRSDISFHSLIKYMEAFVDNYTPIQVKDDSGNELFLDDQVEVWDKNGKFQGRFTIVWLIDSLRYALQNNEDSTLIYFYSFQAYSIKKHQES